MNDKSDERSIEVKYESNDLNFTSFASLKIQGQHTTMYPKKNYNIKLYKDAANSQKNKINIKWGSFYKYTLKANWHDTTHSKNIIASDIAGDINKKYGYFKNTPNYGLIDGFPIEIYVNNKFYGLYTLNLHKDYMFEDGVNKNYTLISNQTIYSMRDIKQETANWKNFEVEIGEENQETLNNFNRLLYFIHNSSDEEFKRDIEKYIDLDSILNYYCYVKFADLWDNLGQNLYFLTYDGQVWYTVLYDLDFSYGGYIGYSYVQSNAVLNEFIKEFPLWNKLERTYGNEIYERYQELRKNILTKNYVVNKFETFYNQIPADALKEDLILWPQQEAYSMGKLRNYLNTRISVIDTQISNLRTTIPEEEENNPPSQENNQSSSNSNNNSNSNTSQSGTNKPSTNNNTTQKPSSNKPTENNTKEPITEENKEDNKEETPEQPEQIIPPGDTQVNIELDEQKEENKVEEQTINQKKDEDKNKKQDITPFLIIVPIVVIPTIYILLKKYNKTKSQ